jgi:TPR repeat protein
MKTIAPVILSLLSLGTWAQERRQEVMTARPPTEASAFDRLEAAARRGEGAAQYQLGVKYREGRGVSRDVVEAVRWFEFAAASGEIRAQH